ncbi:MAG: NAD(P)-dependent oxidoreductase [Candidatus Micrarchaeota archaeon]|nr:NAD(P)-dependent oxidoreductase [Candidatus Micrarchaeota archaeon]
MNKKILLSGSKGFIGATLKSELVRKGYEVHELKHNLLDYEKINKQVRKLKPDYVIHLAAVTTTSEYYEHPLKTLQTNFLATVNFAEACRSVKNFKQFIYSSSVWVYAPILKGKLNESSQLQPPNTHGIAKASSEFYLQYLGLAYNFPYTILRLPNVYGRTDDFRFFVEGVISQMLKGKEVRLNNPHAVRDWLYVDDAIRAFVRALGNKMALGQIFLIGSGRGYSTLYIAKLVRYATGYKGEVQWGMAKRITDMGKTVCNYSKAKRILGWGPRWTLKEGLQKTIDGIK